MLSTFAFVVFAGGISEVQINTGFFPCKGGKKKNAWYIHICIMYSRWVYLTQEKQGKFGILQNSSETLSAEQRTF